MKELNSSILISILATGYNAGLLIFQPGIDVEIRMTMVFIGSLTLAVLLTVKFMQK